jgi:glycosyltransferase involved in cell wall biosynthesis
MNTEHRKTRVCFVSLKAYPLFNPEVHKVFGGAEVDLYLLATELAKDDRFDVRFVVGDYGQPDGETREGVTLYKSVRTDRFMAAEGWKVWRALKKADADVYMHEACSLGTTLIAAFCRMHQRRFVYRTASSRETNGTYFNMKPVRGIFVRRAFRQADVFIVQNEQDAENARKTIPREARVIRNGCRLRPSGTVNKQGILWVGRSEHVKRPDLFLKLARECSELSFTMICQRATADLRYEDLTQEARSIGNLTFIERVAFQEIDRYFEQAGVFVNTSDSEGFPNTFVQAAKSSTAILSLNVNPDGFLDKHRCGLCAGGDWNRFTGLLRELAETPQGRQLGENGLAYIRSHHNLETIIDEYKSLFLQTDS